MAFLTGNNFSYVPGFYSDELTRVLNKPDYELSYLERITRERWYELMRKPLREPPKQIKK